MSFYLKTKTGQQFEWHTGTKKPMHIPGGASFITKTETFNNVLYLQADGDELEHIRMKIHNIPIGYSVFIWRDNLAQLIYDNL